MPSKVGAQVAPLVPGKWLVAVSIPLLAGWIAAAVLSGTDVFADPFWVVIYMLVVGTGLLEWGIMTTPVRPPNRPRGSVLASVVEELALGVAAFFVFLAFVGR